MRRPAKTEVESLDRIEPTRLEDIPERLADLAAQVAESAAVLGHHLHTRTAAHLAGLVRIMNAYYSNLIEGHDTRPRDIERALAGELDIDTGRRNLQQEAAAHVRVQAAIDAKALDGTLAEPATRTFVRWLHEEFYRDAPDAFVQIGEGLAAFTMEPGRWRSRPEHDNVVGRHIPPSSHRVEAFMVRFEQRYRLDGLGKAARILAIASAHHRFNYIHPFPDGNGRVSRLMSHAMAYKAGIGAGGLWSISRGLARGIDSRLEYRRMMDMADTPREGDYDGRGNLSLRALIEFTEWFLRVCVDQIGFMSTQFDLDNLAARLSEFVARTPDLKPEAARLLHEALSRGEFERGEVSRISGLPERSARRLLSELVEAGVLASSTPKGPVSLRFPQSALEILFPRLYPHT